MDKITFKNKFQDEYPFKSHFLNLNGHNYHYVDEGRGEVVLMLHGNPTWSFYYRNLIKDLSQTHRVIVPDHMGCGFSDKPEDYPYHLESHIQNLVKLIHFLDLKKMIVVVHDWGGAIGFGMMTRYPQLIDKIIILNTAAFLSQNIPKRIAVLKGHPWSKFLIQNLNLFAWPATFMTTKKTLSSKIKEGYLFPYSSVKERVAIHAFVDDIPLSKNHPSFQTLYEIQEKLKSLRGLPKLILWGGRDFCFDKTFFETWLQYYPDAEARWYADAGHYIIEDKQTECLAEIREFIK